MQRIKVLLVTSGIAAVVSWGLAAAGLEVDSLQHQGTPAFIAAAVVTSHVTFMLLWLELRREKRDHDKTLLIRTLAGDAQPEAEAPADLRVVSSR